MASFSAASPLAALAPLYCAAYYLLGDDFGAPLAFLPFSSNMAYSSFISISWLFTVDCLDLLIIFLGFSWFLFNLSSEDDDEEEEEDAARF